MADVHTPKKSLSSRWANWKTEYDSKYPDEIFTESVPSAVEDAPITQSDGMWSWPYRVLLGAGLGLVRYLVGWWDGQYSEAIDIMGPGAIGCMLGWAILVLLFGPLSQFFPQKWGN